MRITTKLSLASSVMAVFLTPTVVHANAGPEAQQSNCCDDLSSRIKKLEDHAVMSDTKKIILSGFLNKAAMWLDNGKHSNTAYVDNGNAESRLNLTGIANFNDDIAIGAVIEEGFSQNSTYSNDVHNAQTTAQSTKDFQIRIAEVFADSLSMGKVSLGRGSMASDFTMEETDLSGTRVVANGASVWKIAGGASFYQKNNGSNGQLFVETDLGSTNYSVFADVNGLDKHDRIRYDTPKYYGFQLSASHGYQSTGDLFDVAARFAGKFVGIKVVADLAYSNNQSIKTTVATNPNDAGNYKYQQVNGSMGVLVPISMSNKPNTGINLFFGAANRDWFASGQKTGRFYHGKLGYIDNYVPLGNTAFSVDYAYSKNMARASNATFTALDPSVSISGKTWGLFVVQNVDVVASELYAGYRKYSVNRSDALRFDDIQAVMVGARVKL